MRVLIDCTQITRQKAGVGVYAVNLIRELLKPPKERQGSTELAMLYDPGASSTNQPVSIWLLAQDDDPDFTVEGCSLKVIRVPGKLFRHLPFRFALEQLYIPWLTRKLRIDVLHSLHYSFPLLRLRARKVVTVHDLTSLRMPEVHIRSKRVYFRFFLYAASRLADALIFVSHSTQHDWIYYFPYCKAQQFVVPLGKGPEYRPDLPRDSILKVLTRYKITRPYLLYVGTIEPRKNLTRLVQAISLVQSSLRENVLVIAGKKGWMYEDLFRTITELELTERVLFTGFIEEDEKAYLISGAEAFVYPSLYEGFGIPVLEALACGTPTLTSDSSSLREVAGDAAVLVNPESVEDIAANLTRLLNDLDLRRLLRAKAVAQASKFDWSRTAAQTMNVYRNLTG